MTAFSVDVAAASAFLDAHLGGGVSEVALLGEGAWSRAFGFRHGGRHLVARFGAHLEDFAKDRIAARFAGTHLPVPRMVEVGEAFGGYYAIAERLHGTYLDDADGGQMRALLPSLFAMLDAIRAADVSDTTGYGLWRADGNAEHPSWRAYLLAVDDDSPSLRTHGWRAKLEASATGSVPFEQAYARLAALVPELPEARHLIHSDLLHFNVLVQGSGVSAVLDWGCALYGDWLYDLAWLCFWQPWYPAWAEIDLRAEALAHYARIGLAVPGFEQRLRACMLHIGLNGMAYAAWAGHAADLEQTARRTLAIAGES